MEYEEIKEKLLSLLGLEEDAKGLVEFAFEDAKETALNYCNLENVPEGLKNTILRMAMDIFRNEAPGSSDAPREVSSITEGDTTTSFEGTAEEFRSGLLKNYRIQLNRYRRLPNGNG